MAFDMAHGLKTSYMDFINLYWVQRLSALLTDNPYCNAFWATPTGISGKYSNFAEDRLRLGMKKANPLASLFVLLSPCTISTQNP